MGDTADTRSLPGAHAGIHRGEESAGPRDAELERSSELGNADDARSQGRCIAETYRQAAREAHAASSRVGQLRAFGNAIVPQVAAEFIAAAMEAMND